MIMMLIWMMNLTTCNVECQECGLDFLTLALAVDLEKKEPLVFVASSSSSLLTPTPPLPFTIVVSVSARGLPSRPLPSTRERFRENINISRLPSTFNQARSNITSCNSQPSLFGCFFFAQKAEFTSLHRWIRVGDGNVSLTRSCCSSLST